MGPKESFFALTYFSLLCTTILLLLYSNAQGLRTSQTVAVLALFLFSRWTTGYLLFDFTLVDATTFAFMILILWLSEIRAEPTLLLAGIALGCLVKEQVLIAAIYVSIKNVRESKGDFKGLTIAVLPSAIGLVVLGLVRTFVPTSNDYSLMSEVTKRFTSTSPPGYFHTSIRDFGAFAYHATFGTWGAALPLILVGLWQHRHSLRNAPEKVVFLFLVFAQLLVAWNVERLLVYAFPIVFVLAATNVGSTSPLKTKLFKGVLWGTVILQFFLYARFVLYVNGFDIRGLQETLVRIFS